ALGCRYAHRSPIQTRQFGVQICKRLFHQNAVPRVLAGFQFPKDPYARKVQTFLPPEQLHFFRRNPLGGWRTDFSLGRFNLRLDRFTFPTSCHTSIVRLGATHWVGFSSSMPLQSFGLSSSIVQHRSWDPWCSVCRRLQWVVRNSYARAVL